MFSKSVLKVIISLIGCLYSLNQMRYNMKTFVLSLARGNGQYIYIYFFFPFHFPVLLHQVTSVAVSPEVNFTRFSLSISITDVYFAASDSLGSFPSAAGLGRAHVFHVLPGTLH